MYGVIVTAHGSLATGLESALKLVNGEMKNVKYCNFLETYTSEDIKEKIKKAIQELEDYEGIFILTDIMGGTPSNQAVLLTQNEKNIKVLGGVNFSMLYAAANAEGNMEVALKDILEESKEVIGYFGQEEKSSEQALFSDGI